MTANVTQTGRGVGRGTTKDGRKWCVRGKHYVSTNKFNKNQSYCKPCMRAYQAERRKLKQAEAERRLGALRAADAVRDVVRETDLISGTRFASGEVEAISTQVTAPTPPLSQDSGLVAPIVTPVDHLVAEARVLANAGDVTERTSPSLPTGTLRLVLEGDEDTIARILARLS